MKSLILLDIYDSASKIDNKFSMICFIGALILAFFTGSLYKKVEFRKIALFAGLTVLLAGISAVAFILTHKDVEAELVTQKNELSKLAKEREENLVENKRNHSIKDTCIKERTDLGVQLIKITEKSQVLASKLEKIEFKNELLSKELDKYKSEPYRYYEGYAAIREGKNTGKWGYLKKGSPKSTVDFIYDDACRFSEGRAFVKHNGSNKYGIIDTHLGIPLVPCIFEKPQWFENGRALVTYKGERIYIDKKGERMPTVIKNAIALR